jgi:hypothetical protein
MSESRTVYKIATPAGGRVTADTELAARLSRQGHRVTALTEVRR